MLTELGLLICELAVVRHTLVSVRCTPSVPQRPGSRCEPSHPPTLSPGAWGAGAHEGPAEEAAKL